MILEFLGGAAFRMIAGQVLSVWTKWQDQRHEIQLMEIQEKMEQARADRQITQQRLAHELGIRTIEVQKDADVAREEAAAFREAVAKAFQPTGIKWVDVWNGLIRPSFATLVLWLILRKVWAQDWNMDEWDRDLAGIVVGFFFADRTMKRSGK